jgi:hypothetical protein
MAALAGGLVGAGALSFHARLQRALADPSRDLRAAAAAWAAPAGPVEIVGILSEPLIAEFRQRRALRARVDPTYAKRVDAALNAGTLNLVLFGYGEEHGERYPIVGGSVTVLSYDYAAARIRSVSLSRDIRTPELERRLPNANPRWQVLRHAYHIGGFGGLREVVENATGLCVDFQVTLKDVVIRDFIDFVTGPVEVDVPREHHTGSFRLDGVEYPPGVIPAGRQIMTSFTAMQFILAEELDAEGRDEERSFRKNLLLRALTKRLKERVAADPYVVKQLADFFLFEQRQHNLALEYPLDYAALLDREENAVAQNLWEILRAREDLRAVLPESDDRELVIHDQKFGDGGVSRVHTILDFPDVPGRDDHPNVLREARTGALPPWMLIPDGGDPYASDLVHGYWRSVRRLVRATFLTLWGETHRR